ncbi:MAG: hypothetical protein AAF081_01600 [Actinomycetota bacterium]
MFRRVIAGLILGPALLIGSFAWSGYLALGTVFDEDRSATVAQELLDNEAVKAQVAANIATAITAALPDEVPITAEQIDSASLAVLNDPRVTGLVINSLGETHRSFLGLNDVPQTVDLNPVAEVAREQIASISPEAAAAIPADTDWSIDLPTENIPNSSPVKDFLETSVPYLAGISLVMVLMAFLTTSDRPSVLRKAAFWAIGTTAIYLILGFGVPALLRAVLGDQAEIFAALITALLRTTLVPSIVLGGVGAALLVASWIWPEDRRQPKPKIVHQPAPAPAAPVAAQPAQPARRPQPQPAASSFAPPTAAQAAARPAPAARPEPAPRPQPQTPPPTTHIAPARPQASAPPHQPVTPPSTPVVPATPPSNPVVPADVAPVDEAFAPPPAAAPPTQSDDLLPPIVTGGEAPVAPPTEPPPFRPTLPTRAAPNERVSLPAWTGDLSPQPDATPTGGVPKARPPRWVDGHGWVLDPDDDRPVPPNARYVEGVGYVVPGPPPRA